MEIQFKFYQNLDGKQSIPSKFFDTRGGLDNVIVGLDWTEVETDDRLLHQLEKVLHLDLSFLDYWEEKTHEQYLEVEYFVSRLKELVTVLTANPNYYQQINYDYVPKEFLEQGLLKAIQSLIDYFDTYYQQGAMVFRIEII